MSNQQQQNGWTSEQEKEVLRAVFSKAAEDETFRQLALTSAAGAVFEATGMALPPGVRILFIDDEQYDSVVRLPPRGQPVSESLGEEGASCTGFTCLFLSST